MSTTIPENSDMIGNPECRLERSLLHVQYQINNHYHNNNNNNNNNDSINNNNNNNNNNNMLECSSHEPQLEDLAIFADDETEWRLQRQIPLKREYVF